MYLVKITSSLISKATLDHGAASYLLNGINYIMAGPKYSEFCQIFIPLLLVKSHVEFKAHTAAGVIKLLIGTMHV